MSWRERVLAAVGPGLLGGITFQQWLHLLWQERFAVHPARFPRALAITFQSLKNSIFCRLEHRRYDSILKEVIVEPPLFVLGHWRSGTTHLHQLLAQDRRFAFPNGYQTTLPQTFLTTEKMEWRILSRFVPERRPMDNMEWTLASPQEDEFALCAICLESPCMTWIFPHRRRHFGRYLSFHEASPEEISQWRDALLSFLRKLTWKYRRPIVLKSPPHTSRIRLLLELFPKAKFVHIHRDPYVVFQSTRKTFRIMFKWHGLQLPDLIDLDDWILEQYREMYESFFQERTLIPKGAYHEMAYEDLERDPNAEMRKLYAALDLPAYEAVEPVIQQYTAGLSGYKKNEFPALHPDLKMRISKTWRATIEEWSYGK